MKAIIEKDEIKNAIQFIKSKELGTKVSPLWEDMSKDFAVSKDASLRDYSINTEYDQEKIEKFYKYSKSVGLLSSVVKIISYKILRYLRKFENTIYGFISKITLGEFGAAKKFAFDDYPLKIYEDHQKNSNLLKQYEEYNKKYKTFFSHNNYKSFSYFFDFKKRIDVAAEKIENILEIGSGLFNFGVILTRDLDSFNYFCIDLPDVAMRGWFSARSHLDSDVEVYLPHQMDQFNNSSCKKKIIFLIPSQLEDINKKINLVINHESFAEMYISTVNDYLARVNKIMPSDSLIFLVNRFSRQQGYSGKEQLYTNFDDYDLDRFSIVYRGIEQFRTHIPGQKEKPNVFYIARKK